MDPSKSSFGMPTFGPLGGSPMETDGGSGADLAPGQIQLMGPPIVGVRIQRRADQTPATQAGTSGESSTEQCRGAEGGGQAATSASGGRHKRTNGVSNNPKLPDR